MPHASLKLAAALALTLTACAGRIPPSERPHLAIVTSVPYAEGSGVTPDIRECELAEELIEELTDEAERYFQIGLATDYRDIRGRVLVMRFSHVEGVWGGAITGSKSATVIGHLLEGGQVIGSFTARWETSAIHANTGGYYRTTCGLLEKAVSEIAEDVTEWLRAPSHGALLGDL